MKTIQSFWSLTIIMTLVLLTACDAWSMPLPEETNAQGTATLRATPTTTTAGGTGKSTFTTPVSVTTPVKQTTPTSEVLAEIIGLTPSPITNSSAQPTTTPTSVTTSSPTTMEQNLTVVTETVAITNTSSLPASTIQVVSKTRLSLEDSATPAMGASPSEFVILGWTQKEGLILQTFTPPNIQSIWAVFPETGRTQQLNDYKTTTVQLSEVQLAIDELKKINPRINITTVSPDGQWIAGGVIDEPVLLVKQVGSTQTPVPLLSETDWGWFARFMAWSPSSTSLAYAVGPGLYEIRISNPDGSNTTVIKLWDTRPSSIIWSPDEHFIAFVAAEEPQQVTDLYMVETDGSNLTNITNDEIWVDGPIAWSPTGHKIAYTDDTYVWLVEIAVK